MRSLRGQDLDLLPSGYEPDEMSGFLRVLRRVANVSQVNFAQAVVSQMYRKSAPNRAIFSCFLWQHRETFQMTSCHQAPKVKAPKIKKMQLMLQNYCLMIKLLHINISLKKCARWNLDK